MCQNTILILLLILLNVTDINIYEAILIASLASDCFNINNILSYHMRITAESAMKYSATEQKF